MEPVARILPDGARLHLQHGPIDLVIGADGARQAAFAAAHERFQSILQGLVDELEILQAPVCPGDVVPVGPVAQRMERAVRPHAQVYVTRMAAVAGAVADEVLAAMVAATADLRRAYVNNGGDIALHLAPGEQFVTAMAAEGGADLGRIVIAAEDGIRGMATSGRGGRSLSRGIAESVTVLAATAAAADVAATLIANAVDLPGHPSVRRAPADQVRPGSDLRDLAVVTGLGPICTEEARQALACGGLVAQDMAARGLIRSAALFLRGQVAMVGQDGFAPQGLAIEETI